MDRPYRITAIIGTYRKGGMIDKATREVLRAAEARRNVKISRIYLIERKIEFCTNCRRCTQETGENRGECIIEDDMNAILDEIDRSDAVILASPVNFGTVTAVMKRFVERLICHARWPWGANAPKPRNGGKDRHVVILMSSAAPSFLTRLSGCAAGPLKDAAKLMGAGRIDMMFIGLAAGKKHPSLPERAKRKARRIGRNLS